MYTYGQDVDKVAKQSNDPVKGILRSTFCLKKAQKFTMLTSSQDNI